VALLVVLLLLGRDAAAADPTVTAPALKAAFLYNFAKFVEWPADAAAGPLTLCVIGDPAVADALEATVKGHAIDGRDVVVSRIKGTPVRGCQLLYVADTDAKRAAQIIDEVRTAPIFTVGDRDQFLQWGGIAGFFVEGAKMRFAINVEAAQRAHLRLSSRLLSLAKLVKEDHVQP
jgi:hypothetical protein